jgi:hypothetical protein
MHLLVLGVLVRELWDVRKRSRSPLVYVGATSTYAGIVVEIVVPIGALGQGHLRRHTLSIRP